ncbi:cytochrome D1 domain-containing protein [Halobacteriaceae archaeon GCM10025711]
MPNPITPERRRFLQAVGITAVTGAVAGCTSSPSSNDTTTTAAATTGETTTEDPMADLPKHEVLMEESELPSEPQHDVADLRDLMVVTERDNESVALVDTTRHERIGRVGDVGRAIHVHDFPSNLVDGTREGAYVYTQSREGWMYKVDLFGFNRAARVRAGLDARDIAVSRDNQYVAGGFYKPDQLFIADAKTMEPLKTIKTGGKNPDGEQVSASVHALYDVEKEGLFLAALGEAGRVQLFDYTQDGFPMVADIGVANRLHDGFFGPDGRYFFIASQGDNVIGVVDTKKRELAAKVPTAAVPHPGPGATDHERHLAFTTHFGARKVTVWNTETFEQEKVIDVPGKGLFIQKHHNSPYVWADVAFDDEDKNPLVYLIDPESLEVHETIDTSQWGGKRAIHPEFTRDGSEVYISLWDAGKLLVFDSETAELKTQIEGFKTPTGKFLGTRSQGH